MNPKGQTKVKYLLLLTVLLLILPAGCGRKENTASSAVLSSESKDTAVIEYKFAFREPFEGIVLKNHRLRECVYEQLGKEDDAPLYEEELEAYRGTLRRPDFSFTITNGQELDFVKTYFDLNSFYDFSVTFTSDLHDWSTSQLEGLRDLQKPVRIMSTEDTIPAEVLIYFTGTDELIFYDIADVTGTLPAGRSFPDTVRDVTISFWDDTPCTFENLFACMQDSNVEFLCVNRSSQIDSDFPFPLDAAAGMKALVQLDLSGSRIEVKNKECLSESPLRYLCGFVIDDQTDTSVFRLFPQLTKIICDVTADADLSFVFENETLSLSLFFCPPAIEYSSYYPELYPDCTPAVFPALDDALGWREDRDENNFLAIYRRCIDDGRIIECFSIRCLTHREDYYPMENVRTFLRVTDGERTQQFSPEPRDSEFATFGSYQTDPVNLVDINFDGINDITLGAGSFGNSVWSFEYAWIYDPVSGLYLPSDSFQCIVNPSVDTEHRLVRSSWRLNAASHGWAIYRYDEVTGDYQIERQLIEDDKTYLASELMPDLQVPENGRLWEWEETIYDEDGRTVLEKECYYALIAPGLPTEFPDAYYRFCEPDSYWGY